MMNQRMAHWTHNQQIFSIIIFSILIYMVYPEKVWEFIISAFFTFIQISLFYHFFPDGGKFRVPNRSSNFLHTRSGTIFSIMRSMTYKYFFTVLAFIFFFAFHFLRIVIASSAAIFCLVASRRDMSKIFSTNLAICFYFNRIGNIFAFSGTIFKCCDPILRHIATFSTHQTFNIRSFHHAFD